MSDGTDYISYKGHIIPDMNYYDIFDKVDDVLDKIKENNCVEDSDYMQARIEISKNQTSIFQCNQCAKIYIWSKESKQFYSFTPDADKTPRNLLKGDSRTREWN